MTKNDRGQRVWSQKRKACNELRKLAEESPQLERELIEAMDRLLGFAWERRWSYADEALRDLCLAVRRISHERLTRQERETRERFAKQGLTVLHGRKEGA
jgi:hypothetical protein